MCIIIIYSVLTQNQFCSDLRCFDAKLILSRFTHFCVEQKLTHKSCPWSKNNKYHVCLEGEEVTDDEEDDDAETHIELGLPGCCHGIMQLA